MGTLCTSICCFSSTTIDARALIGSDTPAKDDLAFLYSDQEDKNQSSYQEVSPIEFKEHVITSTAGDAEYKDCTLCGKKDTITILRYKDAHEHEYVEHRECTGCKKPVQ